MYSYIQQSLKTRTIEIRPAHKNTNDRAYKKGFALQNLMSVPVVVIDPHQDVVHDITTGNAGTDTESTDQGK